MRKKQTVLFSIWLVLIVCCGTLLPSRVESQGGTATLTVGDGAGEPGSQSNRITVSLTNDVPVGGIQLEICDGDDFIVCSDCQEIERASNFLCEFEEQLNGCCGMLLVDVTRAGLAEGSGPVFTIDYTVSTNAPEGSCKSLDAQEVKIADDNQQPMDVTSEPGEFCFSSTTTTTPCLLQQIYGENSRETRLLRSIRDNLLRKTQEGQELIKLYYQWSPAIVQAMQQDKSFEADIRQMIDAFLLLIP